MDKANARYEKATAKHKKKVIAQKTGCKGTYALRRLPNHDRILGTPVEPMHLIKNIVEHVVRLITGSEDSEKVRQEERARNRFRACWIREGSATLPSAPFRLHSSGRKLASRRAASIRVPLGFDWNCSGMFLKHVSMKSHCWKQMVSTGILKFCIRGLLGKQQRHTLFFLCDTLARVCAEVVYTTQLDSLEQEIHTVLALLERDFPVSLHVCVFHLLHHLPVYIRRFGPVYSYWMFPFEQFNSWLIRRAYNRRYPESTLVETYRLHEWANFSQATGDIPNKSLSHLDLPLETSSVNSTTKQLSIDHHHHLQIYYQLSVPQYKSLCERYDEEKRKAKVRHTLRQFPEMALWTPSYGPLLTAQERQMCKGVSSDVTWLNQYIYDDAHGRKVVLQSKDRDTVHTSSSYVYKVHSQNEFIIGQVQLMFSHFFVEVNTLAYVQWFGVPQTDRDSGLMFVDKSCETSFHSVVSVKSLSKPLVTAVDLDLKDRLWILSYLSM